MFTLFALDIHSQTGEMAAANDTIVSYKAIPDSMKLDSVYKEMTLGAPALSPDSSRAALKRQQQAGVPEIWKPNPTTATWLALVIPGGGQIYNRKYSYRRRKSI